MKCKAAPVRVCGGCILFCLRCSQETVHNLYTCPVFTGQQGGLFDECEYPAGSLAFKHLFTSSPISVKRLKRGHKKDLILIYLAKKLILEFHQLGTESKIKPAVRAHHWKNSGKNKLIFSNTVNKASKFCHNGTTLGTH